MVLTSRAAAVLGPGVSVQRPWISCTDRCIVSSNHDKVMQFSVGRRVFCVGVNGRTSTRTRTSALALQAPPRVTAAAAGAVGGAVSRDRHCELSCAHLSPSTANGHKSDFLRRPFLHRSVKLAIRRAMGAAGGGGRFMQAGGAGETPLQTGVSVQKSDDEWRALLSPEQFRILRQKGTEYPGTGKYNKCYEEGVYECAGCGTPLYKSTTKFDSGCGWPAFFEGLPGAIRQSVDADGYRIEITCAVCGGHLGHVFKGEGFPTPTNERHCVNSVSLTFKPADS